MRLTKTSNHALSEKSYLAEKKGHAAIILCQHLLWWSSAFVAGSTSYILAKGGLSTEALVCEGLLLANVSLVRIVRAIMS